MGHQEVTFYPRPQEQAGGKQGHGEIHAEGPVWVEGPSPSNKLLFTVQTQLRPPALSGGSIEAPDYCTEHPESPLAVVLHAAPHRRAESWWFLSLAHCQRAGIPRHKGAKGKREGVINTELYILHRVSFSVIKKEQFYSVVTWSTFTPHVNLVSKHLCEERGHNDG